MDDARDEYLDLDALTGSRAQYEPAADQLIRSQASISEDAGSQARLTFDFDIELDVGDPIFVSDEQAYIYGRFRHAAERPISLQPGVVAALNLGVRLVEKGGTRTIFEERMATDAGRIPPGEWVAVTFAVPRTKIESHKPYEFVVDLVKEEEYWFATTGQPARRFDVTFLDRSGVALPPVRIVEEQWSVAANAQTIIPTDRAPSAGLQIVFDVSDLIQYFQDARLPTGIQRVQIEIITNLIFSNSKDFDLKLCCFTKDSDNWRELPVLFFNHIGKLSLVSGDTEAGDWRRGLEELKLHLSQAKPLVFKRGAYLINLGTSWWLQNYFLHVRDAKARFGIRYVPYVHDCIPIITPEHCVDNLTRDFITWALGAFQHADHVIVNSRATAADVKAVAGRLGHVIEEPEVVTLDADFRSATSRLPRELMSSGAGGEILLRNDLTPSGYVLFVSTIESRKNHLMAFSAWLTLVKRHGPERVPKLVCVGNRGWLNDAIYAKLAASRILQQKVVLLSKISDPDLETLYRNCLFTLYPSSYEGWGLPVTESLCYGKVPVLADSSSLPEAGGPFAEYFDVRSETELLGALERMIFDDGYRAAKEKRVVEGFRARGWVDIANQVVGLVRTWAEWDRPIDEGKEIFSERDLWPFPVELGRYYGITENLETQIWPGMSSGEIYRQGANWWWPEPWGCWTKPGVARLAFVAPLPPGEAAVLYIGVRGVQGTPCRAIVNATGIGRREISLQPDQTRWLIFRLPAARAEVLSRAGECALIELRISADMAADFRAQTGGLDPRVASVGVIGFMVAQSDDWEARMAFVEELVMDDMTAARSDG